MEYLNTDQVRLSPDKSRVVFLDQSLLPLKEIWTETDELSVMFDAIKALKVRGAPCIGIFAGYCMAVRAGVYLKNGETVSVMAEKLTDDAEYLVESRPTAVNLSYAVGRVLKKGLSVLSESGTGTAGAAKAMMDEAVCIHEEDISMCRRISEFGLTLLNDGDGVLTHCNAGPLATSRYGTAIGPVLLGHRRGMRFSVFADETRPLLQGARLTSYELFRAGVDVTLICDNMASIVMRQGRIQACMVGCDRVAANGDTANKIGTSGVAILAKHYGIPFYVLGPLSSFDMSCDSGEDIEIEYRSPDEISKGYFREAMAPEGVQCLNPAFDITDASLITAIVTDQGILRPPFRESIAKAQAKSR